jgi:hypothetical protein
MSEWCDGRSSRSMDIVDRKKQSSYGTSSTRIWMFDFSMYVCTGSCPEINHLKEIEIGMLVEVFIVDLVNKKKEEHEHDKTNKLRNRSIVPMKMNVIRHSWVHTYSSDCSGLLYLSCFQVAIGKHVFQLILLFFLWQWDNTLTQSRHRHTLSTVDIEILLENRLNFMHDTWRSQICWQSLPSVNSVHEMCSTSQSRTYLQTHWFVWSSESHLFIIV